MNTTQKKTLGLIDSIRNHIKESVVLAGEINRESLAIEKAQKEQMTNLGRIIEIQDK